MAITKHALMRFSKQRVGLLLLGNFILGVGLPLILDAATPIELSFLEQTLVAVCLFSGLTAVEILLRVEQIFEAKRDELSLWKMRSDIDTVLTEIRTDLHEVATEGGPNDTFFYDHYTQELELISSRLHDTIANREILIERHHVSSTHALFSIYSRPDCNEFRATSICGEIGDDFDVTFQVYFNEWLKRMQSGDVTTLRRLFIFDDTAELEREAVRKLLAFHLDGHRALSGRVMPLKVLLRFKADYQIHDSSLDVGVFSSDYLYLGETRNDLSITGRFSRDEKLIQGYTSMFDGAWDSAWARPVSDFVTQRITLSQLFDPSFKLSQPQS